MTYLSAAQLDQLLKPINSRRVNVRDGMSHLEAYDVRAHLIRMFGFGDFSAEVIEMVLLYEDVQIDIDRPAKGGGTYKASIVSVGYRAGFRLTIGDAVYTEYAAGDATNFPINKRADAHDFAIKTAESQALKRCAINLGDQFGLSLYNKGSVAPIVGRTLTYLQRPGDESRSVDEHVTEVSPENEPAPDPKVAVKERQETNKPPAAPLAQVEPPITAQDLYARTVNEVVGKHGRERLSIATRATLEASRFKLSNTEIHTVNNVAMQLGRALDILGRSE